MTHTYRGRFSRNVLSMFFCGLQLTSPAQLWKKCPEKQGSKRMLDLPNCVSQPVYKHSHLELAKEVVCYKRFSSTMIGHYLFLLFLVVITYSAVVPPVPHFKVGPFDKTDDGYESPEIPDKDLRGKIPFEGDIINAYSSDLIGRAGTAQPPWPNAVIPYKFDCSVINSPSILKSIKEAIDEWQSKTCIRFVEKTSQHQAYLEFIKSSGCWATFVGYRKGIKTQISVGNGCDYKHVMVHELGHVIGFWHEQSRADRDNYITIDYTNVISALAYNFDKIKEPTKDFGQAYDYSSIMHYPWNAFAIDQRKRTITPKKTTTLTPYVKLSDVDAEQAKRMYKCSTVEIGRSKSLKNMTKSLGSATAMDGECADISGDCADWARRGHCSIYPDPMLIVCRKSCGNCGPCVDSYSNCDAWSHYGFCINYPRFMLKKCKKSCAICAPPTQPPTTLPPVVTTPPQTTEPPNENGIKKPTKKYTGVKCVDRSQNCKDWKQNGRCATDRWVNDNCLLSCERYETCDPESIKPIGKCTNRLGLGWDESLPDSSFLATSVFKPGSGWSAPAHAGRLYRTDDHTKRTIGSWCALPSHKNQFLRIDLGRQKTITALATQGRDKFFEHVKSYYLSYSDNSRDWTEHKVQMKKKIFDGNCDNFTPVLNILRTSIIARYIRIHPVEYRGAACLRVEIFGCDG